ncbi:MAG: hypothetical protein J6K45_04660 [Clostridia bacterium]|nr:hypothetical protein [Clostridia bacterium]
MDNEEAFSKIINTYSELETKLLEEIVSHFNINEEFINSDYWRIEKLKELGLLNENIVKYIAKATNKNPLEIQSALEKIGFNTLNINNLNQAYKGGYLQINPHILMENNVVNNLIKYSYNELTNRFLEISKKIEEGTRTAYLNVVENAYIQTSNGITYQEAIRNSLIELGNEGIKTLTYKTIDEEGNVTGIRNYDIEGAVRRELVTATQQLTNKINESIIRELDVQYIYLSEHIKCRPQHFDWQGTIIKQVDLVKVTKYGEVDGLAGPNCKHYMTPYFGTARGNELKKISKEDALEQYELSQKQRYIERGVRKWKRKAEIFKNAGDKEYYNKCKKKIKEWQLRNKEFTEKNNLRRDFSRENVEKVTKIQEDDIVLTIKEEKAINDYISSESYKINEKLRNNIELDKYDLEFRNNLDSALSKCNNYEGNIIRVLDMDNEEELQKFIDKNKKGKTIIFNEYLSFSNKENYNNQANICIYISSKKGKDIRKYNPEESEILYPRNSKFIIENMIKENGKYYILWRESNE